MNSLNLLSQGQVITTLSYICATETELGNPAIDIKPLDKTIQIQYTYNTKYKFYKMKDSYAALF